MNTNFYEISIENVKKLLSNFFDQDRYGLYYKILPLYLREVLKHKKYITYNNEVNCNGENHTMNSRHKKE